MKKFFIYLSLILFFNFLYIVPAYCEEDFFSSSNFKQAEASKENVTKKELTKQELKKAKKEEKREAKKQKKLQKEFAKSKNKDIKPEDTKGYYGTLPDISGDFKYKQQSAVSSSSNSRVLDEEDIENENLKKAPVEDALFLDIIVKKEKASNYVNDIQKTKFALQSLKKCIEDGGSIQRFNGCVNMVDLYTKNLKAKYENKSESFKESYMDILATNYHAKVLGNLLYNANYYSQYVPTNSGEYSKENIEKEKQKLLNRVNKTLFLINNES